MHTIYRRVAGLQKSKVQYARLVLDVKQTIYSGPFEIILDSEHFLKIPENGP